MSGLPPSLRGRPFNAGAGCQPRCGDRPHPHRSPPVAEEGRFILGVGRGYSAAASGFRFSSLALGFDMSSQRCLPEDETE